MPCCGESTTTTDTGSCCGSAFTGEQASAPAKKQLLEVELLYLDRTICERCKGTEAVLKEAVEEAQRILGPTGVDIALKLTHVDSVAKARQLAFVSSPTIRIMGRDAAIDVRENDCSGCSTLGGCDITCRVWTWQGREYPVPPRAMLLDAILRDAYLHPGGEKELHAPLKDLPGNLERFFAGQPARAAG